MTDSKLIKIYDTTLRDGTQGEGISFSSSDKILIAHLMDDFGIDYIEGGWPGSNPRDMEFFDLVKKEIFHHAKIVAFGSTRRANIPVSEDVQIAKLLEAETPVITIFGKTWLLHVTEVLKTTAQENLDMIFDSIKHLKDAGKEVIYDAEHFFDGYKDHPTYALSTLEAALRGGADYITLCDTNGGTQVTEVQEIVKSVKNSFPDAIVGMHCHNDCDLGVAVSLYGIEAGATMVQGVMNGYGERVGNANLTSIIANLGLKLGYDLNCKKHIKELRQFSLEVDRIAGKKPYRQAPFVGRSAFAHKGGVHANAAMKVARSYEHIQPELVGNSQRILLSDMSGSTSVAMKAAEYGLQLDPKSPEMKSFLNLIKQKENRGYAYENADASFIVLLFQHFKNLKDDYKLVSYRIITEVIRDTIGMNLSEAVIKLQMLGEDHEVELSVAESSGPVGALDHAARIAFGKYYPELETVELIDYKVRILQTGAGADSTTQVLMKSGDVTHTWWTCGASENIIDASWQALSDAYRYKLLLRNQVDNLADAFNETLTQSKNNG
ncbi:MAG: citramalate synthase [Bacteroidia bacterium]|nr:citramalate synthase [Bacteroidia bacterium]